MNELEKDFDAVLVALGLQQGRSTRIPGTDNENVRSSVDLLRRIAQGEEFEVPSSVAVIGGGNVAMDIARSLARLQKQAYGKVGMTVAALEDFGHFLADAEEVKEAREEGIRILDSRGPKEVVIRKNGKLKGLTTLGVVSIFDEDGRFAPRYDETDEILHEAELVIESIGQMSDVSLFGDELTEQLEWNRGRLQADDEGHTSVAWLWSAGDMVNGPDVVHAVADGHRVAKSITKYLESGS